MAYGVGLRKGSSTKSGFDVGRLKTAKWDLGKRKGVKRISENTGGVEGTTDSVSYGSRHSKGKFDVKYGGKSYMESKRSGENEKTKGKSEHRGHHPVSRDYDRKIDLVDRKHKFGGRNQLSDVFRRSKTTRISDKVYAEKGNDAVEDRKSRGKKHGVELGRESNINNGRDSKVTHKKSIQESLTSENQPKRKKRVIQLDPNDISNKRIDDSVPSTDGKVEETDLEISKSAQFRAIKPSSSILSFVDDNLLGRRRTIELKKAGYNIDLSVPLDNVPFSTNTERDRIEESVFRNKLEFFAAAKVSSSFPPPVLPEIAFAGRSNVGKSSLLNALTRQWGVVRTSDKPGHTQTINFFRLASKLCMVDLPGYGFAYAKEEVKDSWEELVKEYISTRDGLQRVCLLIDTKWGVKPRDHELIELMERSKTPYQIVLTKTDIVFPIDVARRAMQIQEDLKAMKSKVDPVMMVSSKSGAGIRSLRTVLSKLARFIKP